jgi:hypothetical protein
VQKKTEPHKKLRMEKKRWDCLLNAVHIAEVLIFNLCIRTEKISMVVLVVLDF